MHLCQIVTKTEVPLMRFQLALHIATQHCGRAATIGLVVATLGGLARASTYVPITPEYVADRYESYCVGHLEHLGCRQVASSVRTDRIPVQECAARWTETFGQTGDGCSATEFQFRMPGGSLPNGDVSSVADFEIFLKGERGLAVVGKHRGTSHVQFIAGSIYWVPGELDQRLYGSDGAVLSRYTLGGPEYQSHPNCDVQWVPEEGSPTFEADSAEHERIAQECAAESERLAPPEPAMTIREVATSIAQELAAR